MNCGTVVYDKSFQFTDGEILDKLAILQGDFGTNYLVVKTTGQSYRRTTTPGCQIKSKPPAYFLPKHTCWFERDTWVELDEIIEIDGDTFNAKRSSGVVAVHDNALSISLMKDIIDCARIQVGIRPGVLNCVIGERLMETYSIETTFAPRQGVHKIFNFSDAILRKSLDFFDQFLLLHS